ncbi:MAG: TSUP family transporter [Hamadaea sp.]|nr:TSUP family transporter [Hamadaea sp.]NUR48672.1 TSUP family transporter [Hamadaea sp.]
MDFAGLPILMIAAATGGAVDAIVGGGGLVVLPAMLLASGLPLPTILGTNKLTAIAGTSSAAYTYARHTAIDWKVAGPAAGFAVLSSGLGALFAGSVPAGAYRPVILGVLVAVALFVTFRPSLGLAADPAKRTPTRIAAMIALGGGAIAFYDGAIGPGTGTFLVLAFTSVIGADFVHGSAMAKILNTGTNLGALAVFGFFGHVDWLLGGILAVCNIAGAQLGARLALKRGAKFIRIVLLVVVLALVARLGWDQFR